MLEQAKDHGLRIRTQMVNHLVKGLHRPGARNYTKPDAGGKLHTSLSGAWWIVEVWPKSADLRDWARRRSLFGRYLPMAEPRSIASGSLIHTSVAERLRRTAKYRPQNMPTTFAVETMTGPVTTKPKRKA
jgi:hypothetical protein